MSMSISCDGCGLEYAGGRGLSGLLPSLRAVTQPALPAHAGRGRAASTAARTRCSATTTTTARCASSSRDNRFTSYFEQHFVTPLVAAVWSTAPNRAGDYPARYLFSFLQNHGMLQVTGSPIWYTVVGGSARYVERVAKGLTAVQTSTPVARRSRARGTGSRSAPTTTRAEHFDGVGDRDPPAPGARACSTHPTALERELLGAHRLHRQPDAAAHRRVGAADRAPRAGVVELRDAVVRRAARRPCRSATT